jgi:hypothetical protein
MLVIAYLILTRLEFEYGGRRWAASALHVEPSVLSRWPLATDMSTADAGSPMSSMPLARGHHLRALGYVAVRRCLRQREPGAQQAGCPLYPGTRPG